MRSIVRKLRERKLIQWALAYLAGAWLVVQVLGEMAEPWGVSVVIVRGVQMLLAVGFLVALVLAWYHGEQGRQRASGPELLIIATLLFIGGALVSLLPESESARKAQPTPSSPRATSDELAVAVLPFANRSRLPEDADLTDGIHDQIRDQLSRVGRGRFRVIARQSVMAYRDSDKSVQEIGDELGVTHLVGGAVQRAGSRVLISIALTEVASAGSVWTDDYERELDVGNLFNVQREVAGQVAQEMGSALSPEELAEPVELPTENYRAYEAYVQGHLLWGRSDLAGVQVESFRRAVALDSEFAEAWAELAAASSLPHDAGVGPLSRLEEARVALDRARTLAPDLSETRLAEGFLLYYGERDYPAALERLARVRDARPNDALVVWMVGLIERRIHGWEAAAPTLEIAVALDPRSAIALHHLAAAYRITGRPERAELLADRAVAVAPDYMEAWQRKYEIALFDRVDTVAARRVSQQAPSPILFLADRVAPLAFYRRDFRAAFEVVLAHEPGGPDDIERRRRLQWLGLLANRLEMAEVRRIYADSALTLATEWRERLDESDLGGYGLPKAFADLDIGFARAMLDQDETAVELGESALSNFVPQEDRYDRSRVQTVLMYLYLLLGMEQEALDILEDLIDQRRGLMRLSLELDPRFDSLRPLPRFQALLDAAGRLEDGQIPDLGRVAPGLDQLVASRRVARGSAPPALSQRERETSEDWRGRPSYRTYTHDIKIRTRLRRAFRRASYSSDRLLAR